MYKADAFQLYIDMGVWTEFPHGNNFSLKNCQAIHSNKPCSFQPCSYSSCLINASLETLLFVYNTKYMQGHTVININFNELLIFTKLKIWGLFTKFILRKFETI